MATIPLTYEGTRTVDDALAGYTAYLRDQSTGDYFDFNDNTFKSFATLVTPTISYVESATHSGLWSVDVTTIPLTYTGVLEVITHQVHGVVGYTAIRRTQVYLGVPLLDLSLTDTFLNSDTGGLDNLSVIDEDGNPVDGATIRVYALADYGVSPDKTTGYTMTGLDGRWLDSVPVSPGATYVVHVFKTLYYGPTSIEVSV